MHKCATVKIESTLLSDKIICTWCNRPPQFCTNLHVSITDDHQREEILDTDTDAVVDRVEEEDGGLLRHVTEGRLLVVLAHDTIGVEQCEGGGKCQRYCPDCHQYHGGVQLPRSVTQRPGNS